MEYRVCFSLFFIKNKIIFCQTRFSLWWKLQVLAHSTAKSTISIDREGSRNALNSKYQIQEWPFKHRSRFTVHQTYLLCFFYVTLFNMRTEWCWHPEQKSIGSVCQRETPFVFVWHFLILNFYHVFTMLRQKTKPKTNSPMLNLLVARQSRTKVANLPCVCIGSKTMVLLRALQAHQKNQLFHLQNRFSMSLYTPP